MIKCAAASRDDHPSHIGQSIGIYEVWLDIYKMEFYWYNRSANQNWTSLFGGCMRIPIDRESAIPLYQQIRDFLKHQIESGGLPPETRLPATRELAAALGVSRLTVSTAYAELEAEGLVYSHVGRGTFVASPLEPPSWKRKAEKQHNGHEWPLWQQASPRQLQNPDRDELYRLLSLANRSDVISFTEGTGATEIFSTDDFRRAMNEILRRDGVDALGYGERAGYYPLRTTIAQILATQGITATAEEILITSGSQQALGLVARSLTRPGDTVLIESPTYLGAQDVFRLAGVRLVGIPLDEEGLRVDLVENALQRFKPSLIYTIPTFQNPTGTCMSTTRRRHLLDLAQRYNVPIIEDDYVGSLRYDGIARPALKTLDHRGDVIYIATFSKTLVPALRLGFIVASGPIYAQLLLCKRVADLATSNFIQRALETYISVGRYQAHLRKVCRLYRQRRDTILDTLQKHLPPECSWVSPQGGLFIWLRLPFNIIAEDFYRTALKHKVAFFPGSVLFPEGGRHPFIRLNFATKPSEQIEEGIARLGRALKEYVATRNTVEKHRKTSQVTI